MTPPNQSDIREKIWEIVRELDCGYCETSHDHEKSRTEGVERIMDLISQSREEFYEIYQFGSSSEIDEPNWYISSNFPKKGWEDRWEH